MMLKALRVAGVLLTLAACHHASEESTLGTAGASGAGTGTGTDSSVTGTELANKAQPGTQQDLEVNVGDRVYFTYDSSSVDDTARKTLERQAAWLQQFPTVAVTIEGHCDERGTREYNIALGERRASAVKTYLQGLGVQPNRMLTISYGSERPVDPGHDEQAWAQNRRAVTVVNVTQ